MAGAILTVNVRGLGAASSKLGRTRAAVHREPRVTMSRVVALVHRDVLVNGMTGAKGSDPFWGVTGASGSALGVRSGHTRRSVVARVIDAAGSVIGIVGSKLRQMKLHELGGTISGNPYLRIPTRAAQTGAGVDRLAGLSARSIPNGFLLRSRAGNLWIATREAGQLVLLYLLKHSIRLRARHIFKGSLDRMRSVIRAEFRACAARIARA